MMRKNFLALFFLIGFISRLSFAEITNQLEDLYFPNHLNESIPTKEFIFKSKDIEHLNQVRLLKGYFREGENLKQFCDKRPQIHYSSQKDKNTVIRSLISTLQFIALNSVIQSIGNYARNLNFSDEEFNNLKKNLTTNYCSKNITVLGIRKINFMLQESFKGKKFSNFNLPKMLPYPYVPKKIANSDLDETSKNIESENMLLYSVKIFRSFCSWGNSLESLRLLIPFLQDPYLMAFLSRELSGQEISWDKEKDEIYLAVKNKPIQVLCDDFICRKKSREEFINSLPKSIGHVDFKNDFDRIYCLEFKNATEDRLEKDKKILKWINSQTLDESFLMTSILGSLILEFPHLFLRVEKFSDLGEFIGSYSKADWDYWSEFNLQNRLEDPIDFESPLILKKIPDALDFLKKTTNPFELNFEITLGELDKVFYKTGKLSLTFNIHLTYGLIKWFRNLLYSAKVLELEDEKKITEILTYYVERDLENLEKKFVYLPWNKSYRKYVVREILNHLMNTQERYFEKIRWENDSKEFLIPINIYYGLFALKYIHDLHANESF